MRRITSRQVGRALSAARLKAAEDRLKEKQQKENKNDDERIVKQIENLEKVFKAINNPRGGDIA